MHEIFQWYPPVGVFIAILAFLGVLVPLFRDLSKIGKREKAIWTAIVFALVLLEIRSIYLDRADHDQKESDARKVQLEGFETIGNGIKEAIDKSDRNFSTTMVKENAVLDTTKEIAEVSQRNLASISGKDSFPCIVPQSHAASSTAIPLFLWNKGKNNLTGVEVRILSDAEFLSEAQFLKPAIDLGTIPPTWGKPLTEPIPIKLGPDGTTSYQAEIWDQTGFYTEIMWFRRGKYLLPWAYKYWLNKNRCS
jgi:hypothetical protein